MLSNLIKYFKIYSENQAPFMHRQFAAWNQQRPLLGIKVIHHVPLVPNTLLKIACLIAAGADVTVTNPHYMSSHSASVAALKADDICYVEDIHALNGEPFDLYFDCGAELYQILGPPKIGAIELTQSGDQFYRNQLLTFPVISVDLTLTKQLETVFGSAESANKAITRLTGLDLSKKSWLIFGFGKIGRGLAYHCVNEGEPIIVADINPVARLAAQSLGIKAIDPYDMSIIQNALSTTDIVITATGKKSVLDIYPKAWFKDKILANMGILDEFGDQFSENEVLNNKRPVNFILEDPTPIQYIDPEFYAHNIASLELLQHSLVAGVNNLSQELDHQIIVDWCAFHRIDMKEINRWFIPY